MAGKKVRWEVAKCSRLARAARNLERDGKGGGKEEKRRRCDSAVGGVNLAYKSPGEEDLAI